MYISNQTGPRAITSHLWQISAMSISYHNGVHNSELRGVKLPLWWCQDVSSGIMWGFLLFIPQINLHLHPHMWVSNRNCNNKKKDEEKRLSSLWGMLLDEQLSPKCCWIIHRGRRINSVPINCLPICTEHLQEPFAFGRFVGWWIRKAFSKHLHG